MRIAPRFLGGMAAALALGAACATGGLPTASLEFGHTNYQGKFANAPSIVHLPPLDYPRALLADRVEGTAELRFLIDERGITRDVQVMHASRPELGRLAERIAENLRYRPANDGFLAVECTVEVTFIFSVE